MAGTRRMLTAADRAEIATGLKAGWSLTRIAKGIDRATSVVSREIKRNSTKTKGYRMVAADVAAQRKRARPQDRKVALDPVLKTRVLADLKRSRTPRQIAGPVDPGGQRRHRGTHEGLHACRGQDRLARGDLPVHLCDAPR